MLLQLCYVDVYRVAVAVRGRGSVAVRSWVAVAVAVADRGSRSGCNAVAVLRSQVGVESGRGWVAGRGLRSRVALARHDRGSRLGRGRDLESRSQDEYVAQQSRLKLQFVVTEWRTAQQHYGGRIRIRIRRLPPLRGP